jgi:hypothetical protein
MDGEADGSDIIASISSGRNNVGSASAKFPRIPTQITRPNHFAY